ncbi:MAG: sigma-70 family RNA polymerase sigma factor [Bacteroidales bacterium]|nr:sigma-70 family RNA polymerase sigma factor [Bacteroidales bacterium]MCF8390963.1 sigma-70 family RNA polymerase sigma factor [Bacteroidales bacterium]
MNIKDQHTDEYLLQSFRESANLDLLGELYNKYMHLVYGVCLKYLQDRESSKDAVMQIFEKLITEIPKNDIKNFKSWLYVVSKNHSLMHLRSEKTKGEQNKKFIIEQEIFMEYEEVVHPIDEDKPDMDAALRECIERLKDEQQKCIQLFYLEEKSYKEICELLKLEEKKVKSFLQNGKRNLKLCLESKNVRQ